MLNSVHGLVWIRQWRELHKRNLNSRVRKYSLSESLTVMDVIHTALWITAGTRFELQYFLGYILHLSFQAAVTVFCISNKIARLNQHPTSAPSGQVGWCVQTRNPSSTQHPHVSTYQLVATKGLTYLISLSSTFTYILITYIPELYLPISIY